MPEFVPKPKRFKPIKPRFWKREFGGEFLKWEFQLLKEFNHAKKADRPVISGTVIADSRLGRGRFLLIPAQYLTQDWVLCVCPPSISIPANWSYRTIYGKKQRFKDHYEIIVDDVLPAKIEMPIKPEIGFKDFQDLLLTQWSGIGPLLRELLAFEFVSSPPIFPLRQAGGLSLSIYDGTGIKLAKKLLRYFRYIIPSEITRGKSGLVDVPWMSTRIRLTPFSWGFKVADADKALTRLLRNFLSNRKSQRFSELSVGLGSARNSPTSIYEPPLTMVDQPTLLPWSTEKRPINVDPPLEITKYIIATQMLHPIYGGTQEDLTRVLDETGSKLVALANSYDAPHWLAKNALFDPNYYGKPQSILRIALASARVHGKNSIDTSWVTKTFDNYYLPNFKSNLAAWPDILTSKGVELVPLKKELDRQILRFITDTETRETGVGFHLIEEHFFNRNLIELGDSLMRLQEGGRIREIRHDVFRSVPLE